MNRWLVALSFSAFASIASAQTEDPFTPYPSDGSSYRTEPTTPPPAAAGPYAAAPTTATPSAEQAPQTATISPSYAAQTTSPAQTTPAPAQPAQTPPPAAQPAPAPPPAPPRHEESKNHFWFDFAAGYSYIGLATISASNFTPDAATLRSSGITAESGFGIEVSFLRLGLAGSYSRYSHFDVATAELDLALVIPTPIIEPYIEVGFGYGWIRNVKEQSTSGGLQVVPIHGIATDLALGLDIEVSRTVQLGLAIDASILNLQRQAVTDIASTTNFDATKPGNAVGLQVHGLGRITFQF